MRIRECRIDDSAMRYTENCFLAIMERGEVVRQPSRGLIAYVSHVLEDADSFGIVYGQPSFAVIRGN